MYSIVNEDPEPLARYKSNVPDELERIVQKTLRKDQNQRYQSAADLATDLTALTSSPTASACFMTDSRSGVSLSSNSCSARVAW